jgi:CubicO group peptidase (beta-lactamase class C family)
VIDFPRARAVLESGLRAGLHPGAQLCVWRAGEMRIDEAFGHAREGVAMRQDSLMLWFSAGKPVTAVAIGQLVERGLLKWETRVAEVVPEFARHGKDSVTVRHLLTHTAGLRAADRIEHTLDGSEQIARLCELPPEPDWIPGQRAGYHTSGSWLLLGEIIRRISGKPVEEFARENIFLPLGMNDSWLALLAESVAADVSRRTLNEDRSAPTDVGGYNTAERIAFVFDTSGGTPQPKHDWNSADGLTRCRPGGSARGPVRELARFYEALRRGGEKLLRPDTVAAMISRQREGMFDETFQFKMDCGLGFILNSNHGGFQMPYGYGRHAARETFGHSGNQSSCAFCDPRHELVVAWAANGLPGERPHQQRQRAIHHAIYEDLGLVQAVETGG